MRRSAGVRILLLSTTCLELCSSVALAQSTHRPTVFAAGALHRLSDDESSIGTGRAAGGGISAPLTDHVVVRGRAMRSHNRRGFSNGVVFETDATRYTGDVLWTISDGPRAAYVGVGVGAFAFDYESVFGPNPQDTLRRDNQTVERFNGSGTALVWGGIVGLTALSKGRFHVQPELSVWRSQSYHIVIEGTVLAGWRC